jgi:hypothetical protein
MKMPQSQPATPPGLEAPFRFLTVPFPQSHKSPKCVMKPTNFLLPTSAVKTAKSILAPFAPRIRNSPQVVDISPIFPNSNHLNQIPNPQNRHNNHERQNKSPRKFHSFRILSLLLSQNQRKQTPSKPRRFLREHFNSRCVKELIIRVARRFGDSRARHGWTQREIGIPAR